MSHCSALSPSYDESQKLNCLNYDGLRMRLYHGCLLCKESETARGCYKTLLSVSPRHLGQYHLSIFNCWHNSDSTDTLILSVFVSWGNIKLKQLYTSIGIPWACLTTDWVYRWNNISYPVQLFIAPARSFPSENLKQPCKQRSSTLNPFVHCTKHRDCWHTTCSVCEEVLTVWPLCKEGALRWYTGS